MNTLKAIIIDDEAISRETLRTYLDRYCDKVDVLGEADGVATGLEQIKLHKPNLVFLDVEMPYGNAFDLLEQVEEVNFETIFVTAYSQYALKALNLSAAYYLLKPVDVDELIEAVNKVEDNIAKNNQAFHTKILVENLRTMQQQSHKVVLPVMEGFEVVKMKDITRCQANGNFTDIFMTSGKKKMICRPLKHFEEILGESGFMRVHRAHVINLEYVVGYIKGKAGQVRMEDGTEIQVSSSYKKLLMDHFAQGK
ncbi:MAG: LytTR family DNA-binding domain-containing protein [Bacteroidia bacterium]|nr:LytTR family DNA-binding domain-containing protein [Bacteroidia bacterium]